MNKLVQFFSSYYPEILSILGGSMAIGCLLVLGVDIDVGNIKELVTVFLQIQIALLGIIVTAYAIFQGMRIANGQFLEELKSRKVSEDTVSAIVEHIKDIHGVFFHSAGFALAGCILMLTIFFVSVPAAASTQHDIVNVFSSKYAQGFNKAIVGLMAIFVINALLNVYACVKTLFLLNKEF